MCAESFYAGELVADCGGESEQLGIDASWYVAVSSFNTHLPRFITDTCCIALSNSDKIAIGVGVPSALIAIAAAIATGVQAWVAYKRYRDTVAARAGRRGP